MSTKTVDPWGLRFRPKDIKRELPSFCKINSKNLENSKIQLKNYIGHGPEQGNDGDIDPLQESRRFDITSVL